MTVSTVTMRAPVSGFNSPVLRPHANVWWTGGTGPFDVFYEWDDNFGFTSPITDTNVSVTSPDEGVPPSDMGGFGTPWYVRVTVIDHTDDVDEIQSVQNDATGGDFTLSFDGQGPTGDLDFDAPDVSVAAEGTLTMDTQPTDGDTMTVDGKTYTFEDSLTNVDGNVNIGGSLANAQANIVAAFDLTGVAGTDYATAMTAHTTVDIAAFATDAAVLTEKVAGKAGNASATTETFAAGTNIFDAATLGTTTLGNNGVKTELELLSNITTVTITGAGTAGDPWLLTFVDPGSQDVAMMTANDTGLTGQTIGTTIAENTKGDDGSALGVTTAYKTLNFVDPNDHPRFLYLNHNIGLNFESPDFADGDPRLNARFLYLNHNIGLNFVAPNFADGEPDLFPRFLYLNHNIDATVPWPWIDYIAPTLGESGDTITIRGNGFDNTARDWAAEARLYDDPDTAVGSFVLMAEISFVEGATEDVLVVTIPAGAASGWVAVENTG